MLKIFILGLSAFFIVACGGDNGQESDGDNSGDECVRLGAKTVKLISNITTFNPSRTSVQVVDIKSLTDSSSKTEFYPQNNKNYKGIIEAKSYVSNGYRHITSTKITYDYLGVTVDKTYDPSYRLLYKRACLNQVWEDEVDVYEVDNKGKEKTFIRHAKYTVEGINISKKVQAGTFNAIKVKHETKNSVITVWYDTKTGIDIYREEYFDGKLKMTMEAKEIIE